MAAAGARLLTWLAHAHKRRCIVLREAPGWRLRDGRRALVQEDDQTKEAKQHQLLEEDIDAILARAEVRGTPYPTLPYPTGCCA